MSVSIAERARQLIATTFEFEASSLKDEWRLDAIVELDAVDCFDFFGLFCQPFGVLIPDDAYDRFQTVGQFIAWLEGNATIR